MLALLLIAAPLLLGWAVVRRLPLTLYWPESAALGAVVGLLIGGWVPFLAVALVGYAWGLWLALLCLFGAFLWLSNRPARLREQPLRFKERSGYPLWFLLTAGSVWLFAWAYVTHYLQLGPDAWYSAGDTWGDIALHLTLASGFAHQAGRLSLASPIFHDSQLTYPFLWDFLAGMLYRGGWPWQWALSVPAFLLALAFVQLLFFAAYRLAERAAAGVQAVLMLVFAGSAAGPVIAWQDWRSSGLGLLAFLRALPHDYSHYDAKNLQFTNTLVSLILPQRGILLGLAVFLAVALLLKAAWEKRESEGLLWWAAALTGLLPLVHVHSFLAAEAALLLLALVRRLRGVWLGAVALSLGLAAPQLAWQVLHTPVGHFAHFFTGWMRHPGEPLWQFLALNFGLMLPLFVVSAAWLWRRKPGFWAWMSLLAAALFLLTQVAILQPNPYDDIKLIIVWCLVACVTGAAWVSRWPLAAWLLILAVAAPGALSLAHDRQQDYPLVYGTGVTAAAQAAQALPSGARILTASNHNHPLTMLSGHPVVMGYTGWLWTYGIDYAQTEADVGRMYAGNSDAPVLFEKYGVDYVCVGPDELARMAVNQPFFAQYPAVTLSGGYTLYRVR